MDFRALRDVLLDRLARLVKKQDMIEVSHRRPLWPVVKSPVATID
jgi:hypothetical protein